MAQVQSDILLRLYHGDDTSSNVMNKSGNARKYIGTCPVDGSIPHHPATIDEGHVLTCTRNDSINE